MDYVEYEKHHKDIPHGYFKVIVTSGMYVAYGELYHLPKISRKNVQSIQRYMVKDSK
jgi:hypothetical protein